MMKEPDPSSTPAILPEGGGDELVKKEEDDRTVSTVNSFADDESLNRQVQARLEGASTISTTSKDLSVKEQTSLWSGCTGCTGEDTLSFTHMYKALSEEIECLYAGQRGGTCLANKVMLPYVCWPTDNDSDYSSIAKDDCSNSSSVSSNVRDKDASVTKESSDIKDYDPSASNSNAKQDAVANSDSASKNGSEPGEVPKQKSTHIFSLRSSSDNDKSPTEGGAVLTTESIAGPHPGLHPLDSKSEQGHVLEGVTTPPSLQIPLLVDASLGPSEADQGIEAEDLSDDDSNSGSDIEVSLGSDPKTKEVDASMSETKSRSSSSIFGKMKHAVISKSSSRRSVASRGSKAESAASKSSMAESKSSKTVSVVFQSSKAVSEVSKSSKAASVAREGNEADCQAIDVKEEVDILVAELKEMLEVKDIGPSAPTVASNDSVGDLEAQEPSAKVMNHEQEDMNHEQEDNDNMGENPSKDSYTATPTPSLAGDGTMDEPGLIPEGPPPEEPSESQGDLPKPSLLVRVKRSFAKNRGKVSHRSFDVKNGETHKESAAEVESNLELIPSAVPDVPQDSTELSADDEVTITDEAVSTEVMVDTPLVEKNEQCDAVKETGIEVSEDLGAIELPATTSSEDVADSTSVESGVSKKPSPEDSTMLKDNYESLLGPVILDRVRRSFANMSELIPNLSNDTELSNEAENKLKAEDEVHVDEVKSEEISCLDVIGKDTVTSTEEAEDDTSEEKLEEANVTKKAEAANVVTPNLSEKDDAIAIDPNAPDADVFAAGEDPLVAGSSRRSQQYWFGTCLCFLKAPTDAPNANAKEKNNDEVLCTTTPLSMTESSELHADAVSISEATAVTSNTRSVISALQEPTKNEVPGNEEEVAVADEEVPIEDPDTRDYKPPKPSNEEPRVSEPIQKDSPKKGATTSLEDIRSKPSILDRVRRSFGTSDRSIGIKRSASLSQAMDERAVDATSTDSSNLQEPFVAEEEKAVISRFITSDEVEVESKETPIEDRKEDGTEVSKEVDKESVPISATEDAVVSTVSVSSKESASSSAEQVSIKKKQERISKIKEMIEKDPEPLVDDEDDELEPIVGSPDIDEKTGSALVTETKAHSKKKKKLATSGLPPSGRKASTKKRSLRKSLHKLNKSLLNLSKPKDGE